MGALSLKLAAAVLLLSASLYAQLDAQQVTPTSELLNRARLGGELRVLFSGSSITCGWGASSTAKSFPALVSADLERIFGTPVVTFNQCYGSGLSIVQLASLKQEGLPTRPDLIILEAGTLDGLMPKGDDGALESMFRVVVERQIPTVILYPWTEYVALPKETVLRLARHYGLPVIDVEAIGKRQRLSLQSIASERVHPNDRGHELIRQAILESIQKEFIAEASNSRPLRLPNRHNESNLDGVRFVPASDLFPAAKTPSTHFVDLGSAQECAQECEMTFSVESTLLWLIFARDKVPRSFSYQIDGNGWQTSTQLPEWLVSQPIFVNEEKKKRVISIRLPAEERPIVINGFLVNP